MARKEAKERERIERDQAKRAEWVARQWAESEQLRRKEAEKPERVERVERERAERRLAMQAQRAERRERAEQAVRERMQEMERAERERALESERAERERAERDGRKQEARRRWLEGQQREEAARVAALGEAAPTDLRGAEEHARRDGDREVAGTAHAGGGGGRASGTEMERGRAAGDASREQALGESPAHQGADRLCANPAVAPQPAACAAGGVRRVHGPGGAAVLWSHGLCPAGRSLASARLGGLRCRPSPSRRAVATARLEPGRREPARAGAAPRTGTGRHRQGPLPAGTAGGVTGP